MIALTRFQSPAGSFTITGFELALLCLRLDYLRIGRKRQFGIGIVFRGSTHTLWLEVEE